MTYLNAFRQPGHPPPRGCNLILTLHTLGGAHPGGWARRGWSLWCLSPPAFASARVLWAGVEAHYADFTESSLSNVLRPSSMSCSVDWYGQLEEPMRGRLTKNRAFIIIMQLPISNSCRAGLVTLLEFLQLVLFFRVRLPFPLSVFLELIFSLFLVLKPEQKLDAALPKRSFAEDRAAGSSLFRRRSRSCLRERLFFLSFVFFSWARFLLTWTFTFSSFLSTPSTPSRPASQVLGGAFFFYRGGLLGAPWYDGSS